MTYFIEADLSGGASPEITGRSDGSPSTFDGQLWNTMIESYSGDTYMTLSATGWTAGNPVELRYDKDDLGFGEEPDDDDWTPQQVDTVFVDLSQFAGPTAGVDYDASFQMDVKSMMTADNLYLSNVYSVSEVDSSGTVIGNVWTSTGTDQNAGEFGEQTITMDANQQYYEVVYTDSNGDRQSILIKFGGGGATTADLMVDFACFASGTQIMVKGGLKSVEELQPGDEVATKDNGYQAVRWVASRTISAKELNRNQKLRPVLVRAGAFGGEAPSRDLWLSPHHRILVSGQACELLFGRNETLVPVKALRNDTTVVTDHSVDEVTYVHFMCDAHQVIFANGLESETFHPGEFGLSALDQEAREELLSIFPQLEHGPDAFGDPARPLLRMFEGRALSRAMMHSAEETQYRFGEPDLTGPT